jgi:hypothetical protein
MWLYLAYEADSTDGTSELNLYLALRVVEGTKSGKCGVCVVEGDLSAPESSRGSVGIHRLSKSVVP